MKGDIDARLHDLRTAVEEARSVPMSFQGWVSSSRNRTIHSSRVSMISPVCASLWSDMSALSMRDC